MSDKMEDFSHKPWSILMFVIAVIFYVCSVLLSSLNGLSLLPIFINTVGNNSDFFYLEITPASWTFSIWGFIYTYQVLWLVYGFTLICRRGKNGYLYVNPTILPCGLLISFSLSSAFVMGWLFTWDRLLAHASFALLFLTAASLHTALAFGYRQFSRIEDTLRDQGLNVDIWLIQVLVLNGLAFYNTWVSIATCLNFAHTMAYTGPYPLPQSAASSGALALLMAVIFVWFILKTFIFEKQLRYTVSPFVVLITGLVGSIYKNWDRNNGNSIITAALLTLVLLLLIISVFNIIRKQCKDNKNSAPKSDVDLLKQKELFP